ncbi:MAG: SDR family NAD(P)-dependent oxidoreductase [Mycobacterium sp.]
MAPAMQRTALVTGAAGGVGRAVVAELLGNGYAVIAEDVDPSVEELAQPGVVIPFVADVTRESSAREAVQLARENFSQLDLLVNNAGRYLSRPLLETTVADFDRLVSVNVKGSFVHARESILALRETRGAIVNVASMSGLIGMTGQAVYAITKGALVQFTRQLAIEHAPAGIRVNAVAPGAIDTQFVAKSRTENPDPDPEATRAAQIANHPLGRISTPEEVAQAIVWLAQAQAITGAILSVDGGFTAR